MLRIIISMNNRKIFSLTSAITYGKLQDQQKI